MDDNIELGGGQAGGEAGDSGLGVTLDDGRTTMRPKSPRAASWHLDAARVPLLHRLLGAEGRSVAPPRVCSAVGRRNPGAGR